MTTTDTTSPATPATPSTSLGRARRSPLRAPLNLFSSIPLGICTLTLIFLYSSIGSAGFWLPGHYGLGADSNWIYEIYWIIPWTQMHLRQAPLFEMTEFEWFHYWFFDLLIAMLCVNLVVTTLRRIPFKVINLGVWMIHTGIIVLCIGSVIYFTLKVEGDAPIARRQLQINAPGHEPQSMRVVPGNSLILGGGDTQYSFRIANIDPQWELLSGEDKGERAYAVSIAVNTPDDSFIRQVIAGYPQYTEDLIRTNNPQQPMQRAKNVTGERTINDEIALQLAYDPQDEFYLMDSTALYIREVGNSEWVQRPVHDMPRYNDYLSDYSDIWPVSGSPPPLRPLDIAVPAIESDDPLPNTPLHVTGYLRYAVNETRLQPGGEELNPAVSVRLEAAQAGQSIEHQLFAFDSRESRAQNGMMHFRWVDDESSFDQILDQKDPVLTISIPRTDIQIEHPIRATARTMSELPFTEVEGTEYSFRVSAFQNDLILDDPNNPVSVAIVEIKTPQRTFERWVFDDASRNRDMPIDVSGGPMHEQTLPMDEGIEMQYEPGTRLAPVTIVAGPETDQLRLVLTTGPNREQRMVSLTEGERVTLQDDIALTVLNYAAHTREVTRPRIVPKAQRDRDAGNQRSMMKVTVPNAVGENDHWLRYHHYAFSSSKQTLRRFIYQPRRVTLEDGREIEMIYSRARQPLPAPVVLDDFVVDTHVGGFTGQTSSILDWISIVRFVDQNNGGWGETYEVSVNDPIEHKEFWYFQAQWDPPDQARGQGDTGSAGLNYTVLGVGNRKGVYTQLAGCIIAVIGMIYAFYIKPIIKRRRQSAVGAHVEATTASHRRKPELDEQPAPEPVAVGAEEKA